MSVKLHEIYWIAAILEGEGYFGFSGGPNIQMTSSDIDTMRKFRKFTKVNSDIRSSKDDRNERYKLKHNLNICASLAVQWMMTIYPIMSDRRKEQIRASLSKWRNMVNNTGYCRKGHQLSGSNARLRRSGQAHCYICEYTARKIREERMSYV